MQKLITGKTKLLGVVGYPVEHSLSPAIHNAAIQKLRLDWVYVPFPVKPEKLQAAIQGFSAIGVVGFSVTIPHKQAILPYLSAIEPIAQAVGAVNTVVRKEDKWVGTNTDVEGFLAPLQTLARDWSEKVAVILGNGGAARAAIAGCHKLGCREIHVVGRNVRRLQEFRHSWCNFLSAVSLKVHCWDDELLQLIPQANLLVNTTPVGMYPKVEESPLSLEEMALLPPEAIAYDLIYNPNPTKFLQQAQQVGAIAIDGLEMLVQQGAAAFKIWSQIENVPVDVMRQALRENLARG